MLLIFAPKTPRNFVPTTAGPENSDSSWDFTQLGIYMIAKRWVRAENQSKERFLMYLKTGVSHLVSRGCFIVCCIGCFIRGEKSDFIPYETPFRWREQKNRRGKNMARFRQSPCGRMQISVELSHPAHRGSHGGWGESGDLGGAGLDHQPRSAAKQSLPTEHA